MGVENYAKTMKDAYKALISDEVLMLKVDSELGPLLAEANKLMENIKWRE